MNKKLILLSLLDANNKEVVEGFTLVTKIVFLFQQETNTHEYSFVSGQYGPFSQELYNDLIKLESKGYITIYDESVYSKKECEVYEITDKGHQTLKNIELNTDMTMPCSHIKELKKNWNCTSDLWDLLEHVHTQYPKMAQDSILL